MYLIATLYIFFVLSFSAYYIFVRYEDWKLLTKLSMTILCVFMFFLTLPTIAGIFLGDKYIKDLKTKNK